MEVKKEGENVRKNLKNFFQPTRYNQPVTRNYKLQVCNKKRKEVASALKN